MNLYKISTGQLITIWVFGVLFWIGDILFSLDSSPSGLVLILLLLIPAVLIFYTIGWNNFKKPGSSKKSVSSKKKKEDRFVIFFAILGAIFLVFRFIALLMS